MKKTKKKSIIRKSENNSFKEGCGVNYLGEIFIIKESSNSFFGLENENEQIALHKDYSPYLKPVSDDELVFEMKKSMNRFKMLFDLRFGTKEQNG